tara:strand:- start:2034 stop:5165 length:3132 start_codon:yes stop_codon:yes gene_type:complete
MKRILFILSFVFIVFESNSQITIVDEDMQLTSCNSHEGSITTAINNPINQVFYFLQRYDSLFNLWPTITTSPGTLDSIFTMSFTECGAYRVVVYDGLLSLSDTTNTYLIACDTMSSITSVPGQTNIQCFGDSTGELRFEVIGGTPFIDSSTTNPYYNYYWTKDGILYDSGQNLTTISNLYQNTNSVPYLLYVYDANGCLFQPLDSLTREIDTSMMFQQDPIQLKNIVIDSVGCKGTNTGSIELNVQGGKFEGPYYYSLYLKDSSSNIIRWIDSNVISTNIDTTIKLKHIKVEFDSLFAGDYTLHVFDPFGCTAVSDTITIAEPDSLKDLQVSPPDYNSFFCKHHEAGIKILGVSGGHQNNLSFYWEEKLPLVLDSMYVSSGTYKAYIIDDVYGCKDSLDYTLTVEHPIETYVTHTDVECFGESSGSLQIDSIVGGVPLSNSLGYEYYEYQWSIDTTQWLIFDTTVSSIDSLFAGTYRLIIKDSVCKEATEFIIFQNSNLNLDSTITIPFCFGDSSGSIDINLTGGTPPYTTVSWTGPNGFTSNDTSISNLMAGTYILESTDALSCIFLDTIVLSEPDSLIIDFAAFPDPLPCRGQTALINALIEGGTLPYTYNWSTSDTLSQIVVTAGNYTLIVTDDNGCIDSNSVLLTEPVLLEIIDFSFTPATCNVGATASVAVSGGTKPYSYIWSNGDTTTSVYDLSLGTQWVIVTDSCGDTTTYYFEVEAYILETIVSYFNEDNGNPQTLAVVEVDSINSGTSPFFYQWYDEDMGSILGETDNSIDTLCEGWYYCITTDDNNCKDTVGVEVVFNLPNDLVDISTTTVYEDVLLWGSEGYTYFWSTGTSDAQANICPGDENVWVEVTDKNGCFRRQNDIELDIEDISLTLSPDFDTVKCDITNLEVELEVTVEGGTGDYTYLWSNGKTENKISVDINPGAYSVTVTDENLCNEDAVFHVAVISSDCIPNVFSPNDDGSNDVWNLEDAFFYADSKVKVFNRYGKLVFKSEDNTFWDGKTRSGDDAEDGAYFYVIDLGNDLKKIKGTVTIIR